AGETNWNLLDTAGFKRGLGAPPNDTLQQGNINGKNWIPAECDVSIRPGWFYHAKEDEAVKSPEVLFDLYLKSVGRGANLLLNVPPDRRGLINERDSLALMEFYKFRKESFEKNLALSGRASLSSSTGIKSALKLNDGKLSTYEKTIQGELFVLKFELPTSINCITIREDMGNGQQVKKFRILLMGGDNALLKEITGTTIGRKRIMSFPTTSVHSIAIAIDDQKKAAHISEIEAYLIDEKLIERKK
ncbi:MAG TPA: alpha-L-fucosidase, partial [Chitinophagaceae bacterium]|nr:alpha-L-fucosidase [Chitinophagaceae bacterium]